MEQKAFKSGFVSIVGKPNVGKSSHMNKLVGENVSIITSKAQTTRHRILGIATGLMSGNEDTSVDGAQGILAGIGAWTEHQFVNAMLKGTTPNGSHYFPAFPFTSYRMMPVADVRDLFAFDYADFTLEGYDPHPGIKAPIAI